MKKGVSSPLVSIGMMVYNAEKFLAKSLDSIFAQEYQDYEIIISDNASEDGSQEICMEYARKDSRITYLRNGATISPLRSGGKVIDISSGKYLWLAADHDLYDSRFLSRLVEEFEKEDESVVLCYPRTVLVDEYDKVIEMTPDILDTRGMGVLERFCKIIWEFEWGNMSYGLFRMAPFRKGWKPWEVVSPDHVLAASLSLLGTIAQVNEPLYFRRRNRPAEDGQSAHRRHVDWFSKNKYEALIPYTMMAHEHINVVMDSELRPGEKEFLLGKIRECFVSRFNLRGEAVRLVEQGVSLLNDPGAGSGTKAISAYEFARMASICSFFCTEFTDTLHKFIVACLEVSHHISNAPISNALRM